MAQHDDPPPTASTPSGHGPGDPARDLTGRTLADFHVERLLGHGGMGEVYLARQVSLDRPVALKVLRPELLSNPTYMARFEAEAWAAAKLNHPNIVHIYTLGGVGDVRFIAMEYVQGTNLRDYLTKKGVPELPLALAILRQAGQAIGAAGEMGLVHRDIKPENLLLTRKGQVKVADFGLCRGPDADRLHLTQPGVTLGTPLYMSPEQVQGHPLDPRSDLYSLGVTAYHMLAGFPPFHAETPVALALKHLRESPVSLAVYRPDLPRGLVDLVMKLLEKDPADRYQSAAEMLRDLARVKEQVQAQSAAAMPSVTAEAVAAPAAASRPTGWPRAAWRGRPRPRVGRRALAAGLAAGLLAGAAWGWADRAPDLLGRGAPAGSAMPGLWMEPWATVAKRPTPQAQYRFAQTGRPESRPAAWLAVPGWHPNSSDMAFRAYVQLARELFRRGDAERLSILAEELDAWQRGKAERPLWQSLAAVARAGAGAARGDAMAVRGQFQAIANLRSLDPSVAELGLEVVLRARRAGGGAVDEHLTKLMDDLLEPLGLVGLAGLPAGARMLEPD